ncbi:ABC transporter permease [Bradyrhizobium sp. 76]|uniref:ABC transporter permease n=1 Tax=Bradyrhizobium sp. 76 TaxID=2782680 RepID=UPI001FF8E661|nr:ABC transporter permease [Bradyrhizobium sp. 76]MCK1403947.1 ABC transporter permease [Bradyrhizobium sp. 76]
MKKKPWVAWLWLLPAGAILVPFFVIPLCVVLRDSFYRDDPISFILPDFTFANYLRVLADDYYLSVFGNTLLIAAVVSVAALAIALPYAQYIARTSGTLRPVLLWITYLPLYVSVIMRAFGWMVITADRGMINSALLQLGLISEPIKLLYEAEGMTLAMLHRYLPLMVIPIVAGLVKLDTNLLKASANLGGTWWYGWRRITLPLAIPGMVAGTQLVFAGVLSDYVLPSLTGSTRFPMMSPVIFYEATTNTAWATASALGTIVLGIVGTMLVVSAIVIRRLMPWQSVNQ